LSSFGGREGEAVVSFIIIIRSGGAEKSTTILFDRIVPPKIIVLNYGTSRDKSPLGRPIGLLLLPPSPLM